MGVSSAAAAAVPVAAAVVAEEAEVDSDLDLVVDLVGRLSNQASGREPAGLGREPRPEVVVAGDPAVAPGLVVAVEAVAGPEMGLAGLADHAGSAVLSFGSVPRPHSGLAAFPALLAHSSLLAG